MSRSATTKMSGLLLRQLGPWFFSTSSLGPVMREASTFSRPLGMEWVRIPMLEARKFSNLASSAGKDEEKAAEPPSAAVGKMSGGGGDEKAIVSYWGVAPPQFTKEDGSHGGGTVSGDLSKKKTYDDGGCCVEMQPWESYKPDLTIDVNKHHEPTNFMENLLSGQSKLSNIPPTCSFSHNIFMVMVEWWWRCSDGSGGGWSGGGGGDGGGVVWYWWSGGASGGGVVAVEGGGVVEVMVVEVERWNWSCDGGGVVELVVVMWWRSGGGGGSGGGVVMRRHMCHAMLLETVAAVPGMVGGMLLHCKSLRRFEHSGGWIKALLEEAVNERMHLMTFVEIAKPQWYERALVFAVQGVFFNAYFLAYFASPKLAHRIVGYLEGEAVNSYTKFLNDLEKGDFEDVPAPAIAIDYWRLPPESTLKDVVTVIRADEAHHRDLNHFVSGREDDDVDRGGNDLDASKD
ncbi:hypothetical protein RHGRI_020598 [Rhododendron griersonianum]|uniref:Ubiquinol oxidase n=1 Tax=Rhododendron griersonianum TaxID=479676 RepID=A0AAV6JPE3_9ERIC|nr:hypothetical protein RHGRI_020598 [Rhododendron griersonianum]